MALNSDVLRQKGQKKIHTTQTHLN